jgi:hypothetical protein
MIMQTTTSTVSPAPAPIPVARRIGWAWYALTAVAIAVVAPLPYVTTPMSELAASGQGLARHYAEQPGWIQATLVVHASAGGLAMLLVPLQLLRPLRRRFARLHRAAGRLLVGLILVSATGGLVIAQVSYAGLVGTVGFSMLAVAWATSAVLAARTAIGGDAAGHRAWTIRVVALTYAAVMLRLWVGVWIGIEAPASDAEAQAAFDRAYIWTPFVCWVPNLILAEWVIRRPGRTARQAGITGRPG